MVTHTGETNGAGAIRPLNQPETIQIRVGPSGKPHAVKINGQWMKVTRLADSWLIKDEWWREKPVSRLYFKGFLENGSEVTVFKDLLNEKWYSQRA